jgi:hypothetical protein
LVGLPRVTVPARWTTLIFDSLRFTLSVSHTPAWPIPPLPVCLQYNLLQVNVPKVWANLFAVVLPWGIALLFFSGNLLASLINWSSALLFVGLNFLLPVCVYIIYRRAQLHHEKYHVHGHGQPHVHGHTHEFEARAECSHGAPGTAEAVPTGALKLAAKKPAAGDGAEDSLTARLLGPESFAPDAAAYSPSSTTPQPAIGSAGSLNVGGGDVSLVIRRPLDVAHAGPNASTLAARRYVGGPAPCTHSTAADSPVVTPAGSPASVASKVRALLLRGDSEVEHAVEALAAAHEHDRESLPGRRASLENALAVAPLFEELNSLPGHPDACTLHGHLVAGAANVNIGVASGRTTTGPVVPMLHSLAPDDHAECTCDHGAAAAARFAASAAGSPLGYDGASEGGAPVGAAEQDVSDKELVPCCRRLHCLREPMHLAYALAALSALLAVACFALQIVSVAT